MPQPRLVGLTPTDDLPPIVIGRGQTTGVLMPEHDAAPHVILIAGQSNSSGNGHPVNTRTSPAHPLLEWWHTGTDSHKGTVTAVEEPTARPYDGSQGTSPGVEYARRWASWHRRRTIVVPAAWGGTGLISGGARWQPTGDLYKAAVREANDCAAATGGRLAAIVWLQGEQDAVSSVSDAATDGYGAVAARTLDQMRRDLGAPDAVIAVGSLVPDWVALGQGTSAAIQNALAALPSKLAHCVHAYGGYGTGAEQDGIHYNAAGTVQVGAGLWEATRRLMDPVVGPVCPPAPGVTATATGAKVALVPTAGAATMKVRWRTTGAWQPATVSGMSASLTASTSDCVEVQARAVASDGATSPWSQSTLCAPLLAQATMLLDVTGPGPAHGGRGDYLIGRGRKLSQSPGPAQPLVDRDAPGLVFAGAQYMGAPVLAPTDLGSPAGMFSVVAVVAADAPHDGSFFGWRSEAAGIASIGTNATGTVTAHVFDDTNAVTSATVTTDVTRPHIYQMMRWDAGVTLAVDDQAPVGVAGVKSRVTGSAQLLVGAAYRKDVYTAPLQLWRGRVAWLAVFPSSLTDPQRAALRLYLRARFNL